MLKNGDFRLAAGLSPISVLTTRDAFFQTYEFDFIKSLILSDKTSELWGSQEVQVH